MRFIHTSDWQIGMTRHFLQGEAQARFTQDRIDAIGRIGALAERHRADFVVVAGDVFESHQLARQTVARTLEALATVPVPVFLLPGNHDPLGTGSLYGSQLFAAAPPNLLLLDDETPRAVPGLPGVEVVGAPWRSKRPTDDLVASLAGTLAPATATLRVAVAHGQVDRLIPEPRPDTIELAAAEAALAQGRWHYLALGDRHSVTRVGDSGAIWYSGAPEATAFDEQRPGYALLVELEAGAPPTVSELAVGRWRFLAEQVALNGDDDLHAFGEWLAGLPEKAHCIVKVGFEGSVNLTTYARLEQLLEQSGERFASLRRRQRSDDLVVVPDALDEQVAGLSGYARDAWSTLVAEVSDSDDQEARDALALLYRLAGGGHTA